MKLQALRVYGPWFGVPVLGFALALPFMLTDAADGQNRGPKSRVSMTVEGGVRVVKSNGIPDHEPGRFPNRGNPHTISEQDYTFRMPAEPRLTDRPPTPARAAYFGVALNGVPFEPGTAEFFNRDRGSGWNYEARSGRIDLGLDEHLAHVQPTGAYHYHALPVGLAKKLGDDGKKMVLLGYAADGFPIYSSYGYSVAGDAKSPVKKMRSSYQVKKGTRPSGGDQPGGKYDGLFTEDYEYVAGSGDLDECNGRFGATPEYPQGIYHYYITDAFPYIARQWKGEPDATFRFKGGPPGSRPGGPPPGKGKKGPVLPKP